MRHYTTKAISNARDLRIGDWVLVQRAGEVIPQVVQACYRAAYNIKRKSTTCQTTVTECGTRIERDPDQAMAYCPNTQCPARHLESIIHFVSKSAMDIDTIGEKMCEQLAAAGYVHSIADFYHLTRDQLLTLDNIKEKSATKILNAIEASKQQPLSRLLFALNIRYLGEKAAQIIAQTFGDIDRLIATHEEEIIAIPGIGPKTGHSLYSWLRQEPNRALIEQLRQAGVNLKEAQQTVNGPLSGQTFLLTGRLSSMKLVLPPPRKLSCA